MKTPERLPLDAKWFVVWLVITPMILDRIDKYGLFEGLAVALAVGFGAHLVDRMFFFICDCVKRW
ncbi:TPA: hypothetical protein G8O67_004781 [Salmonella enterica]|uniref:Uncharacterized protein n=1 Tax=Salmonella enterica TaxID=28901 RepID=A0A756IDZ9_SALER|nr:hypothetical protein [Salmonella enterica]